MSELIQSVTSGIFPFPQGMRRDLQQRKREKTEFSRWLANKPVNSNTPYVAEDTLVLTMEDELMLMKLREIARPFPPADAYTKAALTDVTVDEEGQYALPFIGDTHVDQRI